MILSSFAGGSYHTARSGPAPILKRLHLISLIYGDRRLREQVSSPCVGWGTSPASIHEGESGPRRLRQNSRVRVLPGPSVAWKTSTFLGTGRRIFSSNVCPRDYQLDPQSQPWEANRGIPLPRKTGTAKLIHPLLEGQQNRAGRPSSGLGARRRILFWGKDLTN